MEIPSTVSDSQDCIRHFSSLTVLKISGCDILSSLKQFLQPAYIPGVKKITVDSCKNLVSVPAERFKDFCA